VYADARAGDKERIEHAQHALGQTLGQFERLYAKFRTESKGPAGITTGENEWWVDGANIRAKSESVTSARDGSRVLSTYKVETALLNGVATSLIESSYLGRDQKFATIERRSRDKWIGGNLWSATGLTAFDDPLTRWTDLWELKNWEHRPAPPMNGFAGPGIESRRTQRSIRAGICNHQSTK
jgi:hypothetical protein